MTRFVFRTLQVVTLLAVLAVQANAVDNPDTITAFFPTMEGPGNLGQTASTVAALQLAQTMRSRPWPHNPEEHNFGKGFVYKPGIALPALTHDAATQVASALKVRAQLVVWGRAFSYGGDTLMSINVTLPRYKAAPSFDCSPKARLKCDYRRKNFEIWRLPIDGDVLTVDVPRRRFAMSAVILKASVVESFTRAVGLPIRTAPHGGTVLGYTGPDIDFEEFNTRLPQAPARVRSGDVRGYVSLPELSTQVLEYASTVGGVLQFFRGDWDEARRSFTKVVKNPKTRQSLRVDALLYRGVATVRSGGNGRVDFVAAGNIAPHDQRVLRYQVMGEIAMGGKKDTVRRMIAAKSFLFSPGDAWVRKVKAWLGRN